MLRWGLLEGARAGAVLAAGGDDWPWRATRSTRPGARAGVGARCLSFEPEQAACAVVAPITNVPPTLCVAVGGGGALRERG